MYNEVHFEKPPVSQSESQDKFSCHLDDMALIPHHMTTTSINMEESTDSISNVENGIPIEHLYQSNTGCTHEGIILLKSKLFFIRYTLENTLRLLVFSRNAVLHVGRDAASCVSDFCTCTMHIQI